MKKIIMVLLVLSTIFVTGCEKKPNDNDMISTPPIDSDIANPNIVAFEESIVLYHDDNDKGEAPDGTGFFRIHVISENAVGLRLIANNPALEQPNITMTKSSMGAPFSVDDLLEFPLSGGAYGNANNAPKPKEQLTENDLIIMECKVIFADDSEQDCVNKISIENLIEYNYGPVYLIEKNGEFGFSLTME